MERLDGSYRNASSISTNKAEGDGVAGTSKTEKGLTDEQRIGFLNQCKLELSAEVIKWKEESHKQKKENELLSQKVDELQSFANNLARKNHELETSLFLSWEENKRLRVRTLTIGEENSALQEKLSKTKFHSYPWFEHKTPSASTIEYNCDEPGSGETLQEVSQKLLQQMQKEIKEMQQLSQTLAERDKIVECIEKTIVPVSSQKTDDTMECEALRECVASLSSEIANLKKLMKLQNDKVQFLLKQITQASEKRKSISTSSALKTSNESGPGETNCDDQNRSRPTDETFRAYFTEQLSKNGPADKKVTHVYVNREDSAQCHDEQKHTFASMNQPLRSGQKVAIPSHADPKKVVNKMPNYNEKRLCPICEMAFPVSCPDEEFEAHVMDHLDAVSATLLDQYEMV